MPTCSKPLEAVLAYIRSTPASPARAKAIHTVQELIEQANLAEIQIMALQGYSYHDGSWRIPDETVQVHPVLAYFMTGTMHDFAQPTNSK